MNITKGKIFSNSNGKKSFAKIILYSFILILFGNTITFTQNSRIKSSAKIQMDASKYSEAIDLLNKHISSQPRDSEGYALRA